MFDIEYGMLTTNIVRVKPKNIVNGITIDPIKEVCASHNINTEKTIPRINFRSPNDAL